MHLQVKDLISRLGTTQTKVARDCGISISNYLSQWLNGKNTQTSASIRVGTKAMQWYEANKSRQPPTYNQADAKRARLQWDNIRTPISYLRISLDQKH